MGAVAIPEIDWRALSVDIQAHWMRPVDLAREMGFGQSTTMAAWHGRPVGSLPLLMICATLSAHPLRYLVVRPPQ